MISSCESRLRFLNDPPRSEPPTPQVERGDRDTFPIADTSHGHPQCRKSPQPLGPLPTLHANHATSHDHDSATGHREFHSAQPTVAVKNGCGGRLPLLSTVHPSSHENRRMTRSRTGSLHLVSSITFSCYSHPDITGAFPAPFSASLPFYTYSGPNPFTLSSAVPLVYHFDELT